MHAYANMHVALHTHGAKHTNVYQAPLAYSQVYLHETRACKLTATHA